MLNRIRPYFSCHLQAALASFNALCFKPFATLIIVMVIGIVLTVPALFWVITDNTAHLNINWQAGERISLYLKAPLSLKEQTDFLEEIKTKSNVASAILKTPEEALTELKKQEGMSEIIGYLPNNPLPALIEVLPDSKLKTRVELEQLFNQLKELPLVDQAKLDLEWMVRLQAIMTFVSAIAKAFIVLLLLAVLLIIGNTLRMAIQKRHEEIQVLKLIGAADRFIIRPFLYAGIWYGLLGGIFAILFVNCFIIWMANAASHLASAYHMHFTLLGLSVRQAYCILFVAILLSWLSAALSVRKQLTSIEPYN